MGRRGVICVTDVIVPDVLAGAECEGGADSGWHDGNIRGFAGR